MDGLDRIRGMLAGVALGDTLGAPLEFKHNSDKKYTGYIEFKTTWNTRAGKKELAIGQFTDDTEMTLTLMRSLIENNGYDKEEVILSYMNWANSTWSLGRNTRALLKGIKTLKGYYTRFNGMRKTKEFKNNQSNGCLMRATPLIFFHDACEQDTTITNIHPVCINSVKVYIRILRYLYAGHDTSSIMTRIHKYITAPSLRNIYEKALLGDEPNMDENKGFILHAMWLIFFILDNLGTIFTTFEDTIDWVIDSHRGSDTDTNAAIVGGMLGIYFGLEKMLMEEKTAYNFPIIINRNRKESKTPRDKRYMLTDFYKLTENYYNISS